MGEPHLDENDNVVINDNIRTRESQGEMAYWKFAKTHLFCFSPFHQKGGVAASNLKYHGQRHFVAKKSEEEGVLFKTGPQSFVPKAKILLEGNGELFSKNLVSSKNARLSDLAEIMKLEKNFGAHKYITPFISNEKALAFYPDLVKTTAEVVETFASEKT